MNKAMFLVKKIAGMDYANLFRTVRTAHERSGRPSLLLFADIVYCGFRYSAGHTDYLQAEMYDLDSAQRETIITSGVSNSFVAGFNDPQYSHWFHSKAEFNEKFSKYIKRDWAYVDTGFSRKRFDEFVKGKDVIILKPIDGSGGDGVEKLTVNESTYGYVTAKAPCLIEEAIVQCREIAELNPTSVNTIRPLTFVKDDGEAVMLAAYLRIGRGGIVDNFCGGGMVCPINVETGVIEYPAVDGENNVYYTHPVSGVPVVGFAIPHFDEIKRLVLEAATLVPQVRYVGWDIAVTDNGLEMIEGNEYPSHPFFNFRAHHPDGYGLKKEFEQKMGML